MAETSPSFKNLTGLTTVVKWFIYAQVITSIIAIVFNFLEYQVLVSINNDIYNNDEFIIAAEASDTRQGLIGICQIAVYIVSAFLILRWIYCANYNAHQLGATEMHFTPGWSIGWYFIPIANLWKPYQAMKEIWQVSANPHAWQTQLPPPIAILVVVCLDYQHLPRQSLF